MQEIIDYLASLGTTLEEVKASLAPFGDVEFNNDLAHNCPLAKCLKAKFPEQKNLVVGAFPVTGGFAHTLWLEFPKENPIEGVRLERIELQGAVHEYLVDFQKRYFGIRS